MKSVWVFQDLTEGIVRVFAREDNAKEFALNYFEEFSRAFFLEDEDEQKFFEKEKERFMEDWSADYGMIRLEEMYVE